MKVWNGYAIPETCNVEETLHLAKIHAHPRDGCIAFDEGPHKYYICGQSDFVSATTFIHGFFPEFDSVAEATRMVTRNDFFTTPRYEKYASLTHTSQSELIDKIVEMWNANGAAQSALGTQMHRQIEVFQNSGALPDTITKEFGHFLKYQEEVERKGWSKFRTEMLVWHQDYKLCGSIDMIYLDPGSANDFWAWQAHVNGAQSPLNVDLPDALQKIIMEYVGHKLRVHLVDWKRSKNITRNGFGKFGLGPCGALPNANGWHYVLQLNLYKMLVEANYDMDVLSMTNLVFHPDNDSYLAYDIEDAQDLILDMARNKKRKRE
jgi:hypothetical protein